jgi:hypothetical protein
VTDLNFATRKSFCHEVADAVRGSGYHFIAMTRIDLADDIDLLLDLKAAGFGEYCLGVESEDPSVLAIFNKKVDASLQTQRLLTFAEHDVYVHSAIIYGIENQDTAAIHRTARWCADARIVHPTFVCLSEYPFQRLLFGARQDVNDHCIIQEVPTYQHYSFVGIFPRHMRPSHLQRGIIDSYRIFFERSFELPQKPQRRARLKMYEKSVFLSLAGMKRHVHFLENLERPFYRPDGTLIEELLIEQFDAKYGGLKRWLKKTRRLDSDFVGAYAR